MLLSWMFISFHLFYRQKLNGRVASQIAERFKTYELVDLNF